MSQKREGKYDEGDVRGKDKDEYKDGDEAENLEGKDNENSEESEDERDEYGNGEGKDEECVEENGEEDDDMNGDWIADEGNEEASEGEEAMDYEEDGESEEDNSGSDEEWDVEITYMNLRRLSDRARTTIPLTGIHAAAGHFIIMAHAGLIREYRENVSSHGASDLSEADFLDLDVSCVTRRDIFDVFKQLNQALIKEEIYDYLYRRFEHQNREELQRMVDRTLSTGVLLGIIRRERDTYHYRIPYLPEYADFVPTTQNLLFAYDTNVYESDTERRNSNQRQGPILSTNFSELRSTYFSAENIAFRNRYNLKDMLVEPNDVQTQTSVQFQEIESTGESTNSSRINLAETGPNTLTPQTGSTHSQHNSQSNSTISSAAASISTVPNVIATEVASPFGLTILNSGNNGVPHNAVSRNLQADVTEGNNGRNWPRVPLMLRRILPNCVTSRLAPSLAAVVRTSVSAENAIANRPGTTLATVDGSVTLSRQRQRNHVAHAQPPSPTSRVPAMRNASNNDVNDSATRSSGVAASNRHMQNGRGQSQHDNRSHGLPRRRSR